MTEADETLSRLFAAETPERDAAFADAVDVRLRRARVIRYAILAVKAAAFVVLSGAAWFAWRTAEPLFAEVLAPVAIDRMEILGAPAPALAILFLAGLWLVSRRRIRLA